MIVFGRTSVGAGESTDSMTRFVIGRDPPTHGPHIILEDRTVSRSHAAIVVADGRCVLSDTDSTSGTFIRERGEWRRISSAIVSLADRVRFGAFVTTIDELLKRATEIVAESEKGKSPSDTKAKSSKGARVERDPETGQIVIRSR